MYEKSASAECYSQTKEKYEHTTVMLVKVARVENTDYADLMRLKQILMALSVECEIEVTILSSHLLPWVNVFSTLQCSGLIQAKERYKHTTALLIKVARVEITAHTGLMWLQQTFIALVCEGGLIPDTRDLR